MDARRALFRTILLAGLLGSTGCGLILDFTPSETAAEPRPFLCEAEIFRDAGTEFTEQWQAWVFAAGDIAAGAMCTLKLEEYKTRALAPGFLWGTRNVRMTEGSAVHADPLFRKEPATECAADEHGPPFTAGGPLGADVVLENPSPDDARITVIASIDGSLVSAEPSVRVMALRLAERHGFPGRLPPFDYDRLERHIRVSDFFLEVETPFALGEVRVDKLYLQAVGTIYATPLLADPGGWLLEARPTGKFFFFGRASLDGDGEVTSFCFPAAPQLLHASQGPASAGFAFSLALPDVGGLPLSILFRFGNRPEGLLVPADRHQPFVTFAGRETAAFDVQLGGAAGDVFHDSDGDLVRVLWFENFETGAERFLGEGRPLTVRLAPGEHEITAVAYDARGAYNFDTAAVRVRVPVAVDDAYSTDEDTPLAIPAPGVLANDTDAGVPRAAGVVSAPSHGLVALSADGSFVYTPDPNFFGIDGFTYRVDHDGVVVTAPAAVTITVVELTPQEEADRLAEACDALLASGALSAGQANSCRAQLDAARDALDRGAVATACNTLRAFVNHIASLVGDGALTPEEARPLLDGADNLREELGCGALAP